MLLKPNIKRVRLTAVDPDGAERSKTITLYDATPSEAIEMAQEAAVSRAKPYPRRPRVSHTENSTAKH